MPHLPPPSTTARSSSRDELIVAETPAKNTPGQKDKATSAARANRKNDTRQPPESPARSRANIHKTIIRRVNYGNNKGQIRIN